MRYIRICKLIAALIFTALVFIISESSVDIMASKTMPGYSNPEDIVIASPADDYTTTSSNISILGACDYRYKLTMNGKEVSTTEHGFFTLYVDLKIGENEFKFENNGKVKTLIINRKKSTGGGISKTPKLIEYDYKSYGTVVYDYLMPRVDISESDVNYMPIAEGTQISILGEQGNYYKIIDGTFVSKSGLEVTKGRLKNNKVTKVKVTDNTAENCVQAVLTMNINAMHYVEVTAEKVNLTLYGTVSTKKVVLEENDTISKVTYTTDKDAKKVTYSFMINENTTICGYDVCFDGNLMYFTIKKAPHLQSKSNLKGAVILIDAGHGDDNLGAVGPLGKASGPNEKDINLRIAKLLKSYLKGLGATVVMMRSDDTFFSLSYRVEKIRTLKPDISVSIHGNAVDQISDFSKSSGFLAYYSYDILHGVCDRLNIGISEKMGFDIRPTRQRSLSLTRITVCPAVLLETKFLSNPLDYEYLIQAKNQKLYAEAFGEAVKEYLESVAVYSVK